MAKTRSSLLPNKPNHTASDDVPGIWLPGGAEDRPPNGSNGSSPRMFAARFGSDGPTDLQDIARRTVGRHRWAITALVVVGAIIAGIAHGGAHTYTATTRVVLDTSDPTTRSEAIAISDTVQAIATSPSQVRAALKSASITNRDPLDVAEHHVSVAGLGSSAIISLSVSDADPGVATALSNAIAQRVILARERFSSGTRDQELADLEGQISDLSAKIAESNVKVDALNLNIADASAAAAAELRARRDAALRQTDFLTQQRGVLESERVSILGASALRPKPSIVAEASRPIHADPSGRLQYMVLGGLLGLIIGVGLAALAEMIRPSIVGGDALARQFGAPLLGALRTDAEGKLDQNDVATVAGHLRLAAHSSGVHRIELLAPPGAHDQPAAVATLIASASAAGLEVGLVGDAASGQAAEYPERAGIVVVVPETMKRSDVVEAGYLVALRRAPLLGLVTHRSTESLPARVAESVRSGYRRARTGAAAAG